MHKLAQLKILLLLYILFQLIKTFPNIKCMWTPLDGMRDWSIFSNPFFMLLFRLSSCLKLGSCFIYALLNLVHTVDFYIYFIIKLSYYVLVQHCCHLCQEPVHTFRKHFKAGTTINILQYTWLLSGCLQTFKDFFRDFIWTWAVFQNWILCKFPFRDLHRNMSMGGCGRGLHFFSLKGGGGNAPIWAQKRDTKISLIHVGGLSFIPPPPSLSTPHIADSLKQ